MGSISPKLLGPVVFLILVCAALALLTGDKSYLVSLLLVIAGGGLGFKLPPAGGVTQIEVDALAERNAAEAAGRARELRSPEPPLPGPSEPPRPPRDRPVG